jgi:hypothetical protein
MDLGFHGAFLLTGGRHFSFRELQAISPKLQAVAEIFTAIPSERLFLVACSL